MEMNERYVDWKDDMIIVFHDPDNCQLVLLNNVGDAKVIGYDSNFFDVEDVADAYKVLLERSLEYWQGDKPRRNTLLNAFKKHLGIN